MMSETFRVYVVDDAELMREMLCGILSSECVAESFENAVACRARMCERLPDMILLDVEMPVQDGYSFCRELKDDAETAAIPVVFVSASDTPDARMRGYEAGGEDFICKPFDPDELLRKVQVARRIIEDKQRLHQQLGQAQHIAMQAMTGMSELGVILHFLSQSFSCRELAELSLAVLESVEQLGLMGAVQIRTAESTICMSRNGIDVPLEVSIFDQVRDFGRIYQYKSRCVFNFGGISLMINNMPKDDEERSGRIRDNLAILAEGADARLRSIRVENDNLRRQKTLLRTLPQFHAAVSGLHHSYERKNFQMTEALSEYQGDLAKSMVGLGLSDSQEDQISALASRFLEKMTAIQDENSSIVRQLQRLVDSLGDVA